jgi:hypothetical protein
MHATLLLVAVAAAQEGVVGPDALGKPDRPGPRLREDRPDAVLVWNDLALEAIRQARTPPPVGARNLAILHVAIADTVNTIYQTYRPHRVRLRATENIHPDVAVAACGQRVLAELFPRQARLFDRELDRALAAVDAGRPRKLGLSLGRYVADRVLAWRRDDGALTPAEYTARPEVGVWRPTPPAYAQALLPRFGELAPLGVPDRRTVRYVSPPGLTGRDFARDLEEVRLIGGRDSRRRTAEQSIIAWFWDDGAGTCTPPGHWNQIAREVSLERQKTLPENARLFALLNLSLADAGIFCWGCKYRYRLWRPITAIREDRADPDRSWSSLLNTPPFPSYTSGHSTFSGAAATVLADFFGPDLVEFTIGSDGFPGCVRNFNGFWEAAEEAGRSRIYGGIHYECDNREGLALGRAVAREVLRSCLRPEEKDPDRPAPEGTAPAPRPKGPNGPTASLGRVRK